MPRYDTGVGGLTVGQGAGSLLKGFLQKFLQDREQRAQYAREDQVRQQQYGQQKELVVLGDENARERLLLEDDLTRKREADKEKNKKPDLLDAEQKLINAVQDLMPNSTPEAVGEMVSIYSPAKGKIWSQIQERFPQGYPKIKKADPDAKPIYKDIQAAFDDAATRFGGDYSKDGLQTIATISFQQGRDVGAVEAELRNKLPLSASGIGKRRKETKEAILSYDDTLDPGVVNAAIDEVQRRVASGDVSESIYSDAIATVQKNQFADGILDTLKIPLDQKSALINLDALNASLSAGIEPFTPTPDGEPPTLLDVISDAHARGLDEKKISAIIAGAYGMQSQESPVDKAVSWVTDKASDSASQASGKVGNILGFAGAALSYAPAGKALANTFPEGSWKFWQNTANEYAKNPFLGPNHPRTIEAQKKADELRARAGE